MGGRGRKKKDAPPRGGPSKEVTGTKSVENDAKNSLIEDAVKEQVEEVKLVARDLELMGLVVEEVGELQLDPRDTGVDEATTIESRKEAVVTQVLTNLEEGKREGKRVVGSDSQSPESPAKLLIGTNGASSSGVKTKIPRVRWIDLVDGEKDEVLTQPLRKPVRSWSSVVQGNKDIRKGWKLQYVKPQDPSGAVVITEDEWYQGSKVWENALVGYVLGCKCHFKDMANYANNRWKEFQVPKVFSLKNGVFLFDFADGEAKQAVLEKRWTFQDHPLILKQWTPKFDIDNLDVSKIPVWIQFPDLHLSLWNPKSLGKMASYLGVPIATDALTAKRQQVSFARMLVEVEIMEELPQVVLVVGPKGIFQQPIIFEWSPMRCGKCGNLGHEERNCKAKIKKMWVVKGSVEQKQLIKPSMQQADAAMVQVEPNILSEVVFQQCKQDEALESTVVVDKEMPIMEFDHVKGTVVDDGNVTALFPELFSR
ncbi:hypothetical protein SLEP1_g56803 [Rubroshorea leprosula]|uniref:CCHC-type domain-containing protein n=1 Tax=Rubroshorea leprosula TaxID=152421 RepID=A0AAV5MKP4_9ROSI|nr:hypothetical protein SLEP1_g56803 [Rubroshorea leprosula]